MPTSPPDLVATIDEDLDELYEYAPCGFLSMLPDGTIIKLNTTLASWLGSTRDELVGERFQTLLTVPGRIFHDTHYMPLLAMQGSARELAFDLQPVTGPPLPVILSTIARRDDTGRVVLYRTTLFDSSQRRAYERELLIARKIAEENATAKAAVLAMISHDMRSPLGTILMATELLSESDTPAAQQRYVGVIDNAAKAVLQLVEAILEHSKLESGTERWIGEDFDLRALTDEIIAMLCVRAEAKQVELKSFVDPRLPRHVTADRFKLGQIITNLLSNAIKFTERGQVELSIRVLSATDTHVEIDLRVADTGIGIPAEKLATIFEPFMQGNESTARRFGGTGLGLAISRRLAQLAGSSLHVKSTPGKGSAFWMVMKLPAVSSAASAHPPAQ